MNRAQLYAMADELVRIGLEKVSETRVSGFEGASQFPGLDHRFVLDAPSPFGFGFQSSGSFQPIKFDYGGGFTIPSYAAPPSGGAGGGAGFYQDVPYGAISSYTGVG